MDNATTSPARRENYTLRQTIDRIMAMVTTIETARIALAEVGAPRPVIERLLGAMECRS